MESTDYQRRARVVKALAHPSRLLMIDALAEGERCVCELQRLVGADLSTVSKHLAVMKAAGLVTDERRGMQVFYRLRVPCILRFFGCVDSVIEESRRDAARRDLAEAPRAARARRA